MNEKAAIGIAVIYGGIFIASAVILIGLVVVAIVTGAVIPIDTGH